jgi:hypothetical protein
MEGCLSGGLSFCLFSFFSCLPGWIKFFSLPDGLRQLFGDHNPSSIFMCCVIYDLEGSNDANPQDANLTLVGAICFPCKYILQSILFGLISVYVEIKPIPAHAAFTSSKNMFAVQPA